MEVDEIWTPCIESFSVTNISFTYSSELSRKKKLTCITLSKSLDYNCLLHTYFSSMRALWCVHTINVMLNNMSLFVSNSYIEFVNSRIGAS